MSPADLTALLQEPKVREAWEWSRSAMGYPSAPEAPRHMSGEDILTALVTAIAEVVSAKYAPQLDEAERALQRAEGIPYYAFGDNEAACVMASAIEDALRALAPLTDRKETTG